MHRTLKKALILGGATVGSWLVCALVFESSQRTHQELLDQALKSERIQSIQSSAASLSSAVNREVESLYYQGLFRLKAGEGIPADSVLLHVAEWGWDKNPTDLHILGQSVQPGVDGLWMSSYIDRLKDEIASWRGIMGSETQSLTWKSPDQKEMYFTWVVPSGSSERIVRTILLRTTGLLSLKDHPEVFLITDAGVLLSHPNTSAVLETAERLHRLAERPTRPGSTAPFVSTTEAGSSVIVAIQAVGGLGSKLAIEKNWIPGLVRIQTTTMARSIPVLVAALVFGFLFLFMRRKPRVHVEPSVASVPVSPPPPPVQAAAPAVPAEPIIAPQIAESVVIPAAESKMDPAARETLKSLNEAVSDFDWAKLSQEIAGAKLKPAAESLMPPSPPVKTHEPSKPL